MEYWGDHERVLQNKREEWETGEEQGVGRARTFHGTHFHCRDHQMIPHTIDMPLLSFYSIPYSPFVFCGWQTPSALIGCTRKGQ